MEQKARIITVAFGYLIYFYYLPVLVGHGPLALIGWNGQSPKHLKLSGGLGANQSKPDLR